MTVHPQPQPRAADRPRRKVFVKTYGCQMNVYDSQRMADALERDGYLPTSLAEEADLILLNTCHIREKAAEKVYSELGRLKKIKERRAGAGRATLIAVAGCVAQAEGEEIIARAPVVDLVVGPQSYHRLPEYLGRAAAGEAVVATDFAIEEKFASLPRPTAGRTRARGVTAFLTVQEGCDKFCTFCVVPYTRGQEVSRGVAQIMDEARRLAEAGVREITLIGQNVNAWHGQGPGGGRWRLADLLHAVAGIAGIDRLRYTTSHPIDMDEGLIAAHRDIAALMPYLHLPVQAGANRVLKAMNRHHSRDDYLDIVARLRAARPDVALSGDFIVGFPGESEAEFAETLDLVDAVGYASAFSFKYSPRPGTPGADLPGQVPEPVKAERLARLQERLNAQQFAFNQACVGRRTDILIEKPGRRDGQLAGRSPWLQTVIVDAGAGRIGDIVSVRITGAGPNSLTAVVDR
ncbi:MAG: tRNA-2-methylthio-N(6)-dimethylallyladenosine synthase [Alphaproteobacteria bacterium]|nr:MAG: tRNA-2-methylthio-N(6)-dimethylallyladenosine synthase [Alphaproteobacteria bacterium]